MSSAEMGIRGMDGVNGWCQRDGSGPETLLGQEGTGDLTHDPGGRGVY